MTNPFLINVPTGLQNLSNINTAVDQIETLEHNRKQRRLAEQQEQMKINAARRWQRDLEFLSRDPSSKNILMVTARNPERAEQFERLSKMASAEEQQSTFEKAMNTYLMVDSGNVEGAKSYLDELRQAALNSGDQEQADMYEAFSAMADNPEYLKMNAGMILGSTKEGRDFLKSRIGEEKAKSDLSSKNFDQEMKRLETKLKVEEAKLRKEENAAKAEERRLKVEETKRKIEQAEQARLSEFRSARSSIDNMLNTVDRAISMDVGDVFDDVLGPVSSKLPTVGQEEADLEEQIELLSNQAFMAAIPTITGLGALSDAEGKKLANSIQSFSLRQSPESMRTSLKEVKRLMLKARKELARKFGEVEDDPEQDTPDTPFSIRTLDDVNLDPQSSDEIGRLIDQWASQQ